MDKIKIRVSDVTNINYVVYNVLTYFEESSFTMIYDSGPISETKKH